MATEADQRGDETVVADAPWAVALVWIVVPLLCAGAAWLLKAAAGWVANLEWAPFQGPFRLVDSIPEPWGTIGAPLLGLAGGVVLALVIMAESLTVTVSDEQVRLTRDTSVRDIARAPITAVFLDGKQLVLLGANTEELAREACELDAGRLGDAFLAHGFPWRAGGDPHAGEFRSWVEASPDLPASAHALLKVRRLALEKAKKQDAAELREELAKLGVVVRDEKRRQFWRQTPTDG